MDPHEEELIAKQSLSLLARFRAVEAKLSPLDYMIWRVGFLALDLAEMQDIGAPPEMIAKSKLLLAERITQARRTRPPTPEQPVSPQEPDQ